MQMQKRTYLRDILPKLPVNRILNKVRTGCGATTMAITGPDPFVILEPYVEIVKEKAGKYPGVLFPVHEGVDGKDLLRYIKETPLQKVKIIGTFDSLRKIIINIPRETTRKLNLLVDECHLLLTQYKFRNRAVRYVLEHFGEEYFQSYLFVTATPVPDEFQLVELKDVKVFTAPWEKKELKRSRVKIYTKQCPSLVDSAVRLIRLFLGGYLPGNLHVFVNDVGIIRRLVKGAGLDDSCARAVYSKANKKEVGLVRSEISSPVKKINLMTSVAFEGADIFDPEGSVVILSDGDKEHTLLDIPVSVVQLIGRIRDKSPREPVIHLYKKRQGPPYPTREEIEKYVEREKKIEAEVADAHNGLSPDAKLKTGSSLIFYRGNWGDRYVYDDNVRRLLLYQTSVVNQYASIKSLDGVTRIIGARNREGQTIAATLDLLARARNGQSIKDDLEEIRNQPERSHFEKKLKRFLVQEAQDRYGFDIDAALEDYDRLPAFKDDRKAFKKAYPLKSDNVRNKTIAKALGYAPGEFHTKTDIRADLIAVYARLGLKGIPMATHIDRYYVVKPGERERRKGYYVLKYKNWGRTRKALEVLSAKEARPIMLSQIAPK